MAYRGRVLVQLDTLLGDLPDSYVDDILSEDVYKVQKFQRRRKFRLHCAFMNATMISAIDAPVEFEVSIGKTPCIVTPIYFAPIRRLTMCLELSYTVGHKRIICAYYCVSLQGTTETSWTRRCRPVRRRRSRLTRCLTVASTTSCRGATTSLASSSTRTGKTSASDWRRSISSHTSLTDWYKILCLSQTVQFLLCGSERGNLFECRHSKQIRVSCVESVEVSASLFCYLPGNSHPESSHGLEGESPNTRIGTAHDFNVGPTRCRCQVILCLCHHCFNCYCFHDTSVGFKK